jgi:pectate lyase/pectin methylesterase-like acyl-CoA thioesterase
VKGLAALLLAVAGAAVQAQTPTRPQLDDARAAQHRVEDYLQGWRPQPLDSRAWKPDFIVAPDGSGTHRTLQAAFDALPSQGRRHYIQLKPGTYREQVCLRGKVPLTLYGEPGAVVLAGHYNAQPKPVGQVINACVPNTEAANYGTAGSASVALFGDDLQLLDLSIANDALDGVRLGQGYPAGAGEAGGAQAVALLTQGDRIQLQRVQLLGHQDTFYASGPGRIHVSDSRIAGDVDFIFGDARLVIERSDIVSRAGRRAPGQDGHVLAPSTPTAQGYGFLITHSRLLAEPGVGDARISLGRAWDRGVKHGAWLPGLNEGNPPNGQALIRDSELGPHLAPWARSTSRRPFDAAQNRLAEYRNRAAPRDLGREILALDDGWAAAEGGTSGGAAAAPGDVYRVRNRAELEAALAAGSRPKIIYLLARIDLSSDAAGRPLGYEDYRDPGFDFEAYLRAYDPAVWGRKSPEGPLEEARKRSVRAQAQRVVLRIPSHTTLIGAAPGAGFINGMLMLEKVDNIILRGLQFADAYDFFPAWDPRDGAAGEWNSEYDTVSLRGATHVWVDHCSFDDGARADRQARIALGRPLQHHDGLLDITQQSDYVTVSWNHFSRHDKTSLVGGSDNHTGDAGRLRVSFHHNLWAQLMERTPRVRYGQVHLYNNLFVAHGDGDYPYGYSIGIGLASRIVSERNVWETPAEIPASRLARLLKGSALSDQGSLHNGGPLDLLAALRAANPGAELAADVGWRPQLAGPLDEAGEVAAKVRAGAGAAWLESSGQSRDNPPQLKR